MSNYQFPRIALGVLCLSYLCANCGSSGNGATSNAAGTSPGGSPPTGGTSPAAGHGGGHSAAASGTAGTAPDGGAGEGGEGGSGGDSTTPATGCDTRDKTDAVHVSSTITSDQTWSHLVYIEGAVTVRAGAHLTISPGTDVIVADGGSLVLGSDHSAVTLTAAGTATLPIRFCGEQKKVGAWGNLAIESGATASSELRNLSISDAGGEDAALLLRSAVQVENVAVTDSASDGVWASDFADHGQGLSVENAVGAAVVLGDSGAATRFPTHSTFKDNGDNAVHLRFSEMNPLTTFHDLGVPYVQEADVAAAEGKLTFEEGVDYRFQESAGLVLGATVNKHVLVSASGTAAHPVIFHGVKSGPASWGALQVMDNVDPASAFAQVEIHDGGGTNVQVLYVQSPVRIDHVLLDGNQNGMLIGAQGLAPTSVMLTVRNTASSPLYVVPNALTSIPVGGTFNGNLVDQIRVTGGDFTIKGTVPNPGIPFAVSGNIRTLAGSSLTLSAGTQFIMLGNVRFDIAADDEEATVIALGTQDAPIRFSGLLAQSGYWAGITSGSRVSATSKFAFIDVRHGKAACLTLVAPVPVTNSSFSDCTGYGILKNIDDTSNYESTNSFASVGSGKVGNLPP